MIIQTLVKVQELVPSNVLSVWVFVTLLQIAQKKRNMFLNPNGEVESEHSPPTSQKVLPQTLLPLLQLRVKSNLMKEVSWWLGAYWAKSQKEL